MIKIKSPIISSNNSNENSRHQTLTLIRREPDSLRIKNTRIENKISQGGQLANMTPFNIDNISENLDGTEVHISSVADNLLKGIFRFRGCYGFRYYAKLDIDKYLQENNIKDSGVYQLSKSEHLDWVANSVFQTNKTIGLLNFIIVSTDHVIDVLSNDPPAFFPVD